MYKAAVVAKLAVDQLSIQIFSLTSERNIVVVTLIVYVFYLRKLKLDTIHYIKVDHVDPTGVYATNHGVCKYCKYLRLKLTNLQPSIYELIKSHQLHPSQ